MRSEFTFELDLLGWTVDGTAEAEDGRLLSITWPDGVTIEAGIGGCRPSRGAAEHHYHRAIWPLLAREIERLYSDEIAESIRTRQDAEEARADYAYGQRY